jgi:hypothetical protein
MLATAHLCGLAPNADYVLWGDGTRADAITQVDSTYRTAAGCAIAHLVGGSYFVATGTD